MTIMPFVLIVPFVKIFVLAIAFVRLFVLRMVSGIPGGKMGAPMLV